MNRTHLPELAATESRAITPSFYTVLRLFALLLLAFSASFLLGSQRTADKCYQELESVGGPQGYAFRGDRWEGLYVARPQGAQGLEVLGLVLASETRPRVASGGEITVTVPQIPGDSKDSRLCVRAVPLSPRSYYRMDASVERRRPFSWTPSSLPGIPRIGQLGVFAWHDRAGVRTFLPVRLAEEAPTLERLTIVVRSSQELQLLAWRLLAAGSDLTFGDGVEWTVEWADELKTPFTAWQPIFVTLPFGPPSEVILQLRGRVHLTGAPVLANLRVDRP